MSKKEEIKHLKLQNKCLESRLRLSMEVLEPIEKQSNQRGARMQLMYKFIQLNCLAYPDEFDDYFDKDGVPLR